VVPPKATLVQEEEELQICSLRQMGREFSKGSTRTVYVSGYIGPGKEADSAEGPGNASHPVYFIGNT
jgi:hypothetical protein